MNGLKTGEGATLIGRGATLRGELVATEDVVIDGTIEGFVNATGARLTVGKDANVRADVTAQEVVVLGRVEGTIRATERAELRAGAVVLGDVYAKRFAMEQDASLRGRVDPTRANETVTVPVAAAPVGATPVVPMSLPVESPGLFAAGGSRAGLAAAARSFGSPTGMSALSAEPEEHEEVTTEPGA